MKTGEMYSMNVLSFFLPIGWLSFSQGENKYSVCYLSQSDALTLNVIWVLHFRLAHRLLLFSVSVLDVDIRP